MRTLMLYGGVVGFAIGIGFGVACGSGWPDAVWRGSVAALGAGVLLRWWGGLWVKSLQAARANPSRGGAGSPVGGPAMRN
jgi:hypothetical protein